MSALEGLSALPEGVSIRVRWGVSQNSMYWGELYERREPGWFHARSILFIASLTAAEERFGRAVAFHPGGAVLVIGDDRSLQVIPAKCLEVLL